MSLTMPRPNLREVASCGHLPTAAGRWSGAGLRKCTGIRLADLNLILGELAREGRIRITGEVVSLI